MLTLSQNSIMADQEPRELSAGVLATLPRDVQVAYLAQKQRADAEKQRADKLQKALRDHVRSQLATAFPHAKFGDPVR